MSRAGATRLRALCFGELDGSLWGAAIAAAEPAAVIGGNGAPGAAITNVRWESDGETWTLTGDEVLLAVSPVAALEAAAEEDGNVSESAGPPAVSGLQELCRVRGRVISSGEPQEIDCVGTRCEIDGVDLATLDSVRQMSAWFGGAEAITLLALRSRADPHQEADLVAASLFDPDAWMPVSDPRLSTTYSEAGAPLRASLELWVGEGENEFPRRAAAESAGPGVAVDGDGVALQVCPMRCHSRGHEGTGVYLLASF